jgi:hypothetical protein
MKKYFVMISLLTACLFFAGTAAASFYIGPELGQFKPKFEYDILGGIRFEGNSAFQWGAKAGIKLLMFAIEGNYLSSSHSLNPALWGDKGLSISYLGINGKIFFPILVVQPYATAGYGYYTVGKEGGEKDSNGAYNFGGGIEVVLGKIHLFGETRYHRVTVQISRSDLVAKGWGLTFGANFHL